MIYRAVRFFNCCSSQSIFKKSLGSKLTRSSCLNDLHLLDRGDDQHSDILESSNSQELGGECRYAVIFL